MDALPALRITTNRLLLIPFTVSICKQLLQNDDTDIHSLGLKKGKSWPDEDVLETAPKIIQQLATVQAPTGFESWMIIKKNTLEIIGDAGFKGFNDALNNIDLGYGIIKEERRNGYAEEAATALIQWSFSNKMVKEITASCLLNNTSSINLLKKLQFVPLHNDGDMMYWVLWNHSYNP